MISDYRFTKQAVKDISRLPKNYQRQIIKKLDFFVHSDKPLAYAKKMIDSELGEYRFRVGDYRVIFDVEKTFIKILTIGHRREVYR